MPEEWARLILEGWRIRRSDADAVVLGVHAAVGLTARIVIQVEPQRVTHSMVVRYHGVRALLNRAKSA